MNKENKNKIDELKIINLDFAITRFLNNCDEISQSGINRAFSGSKYSKLSDINRVIKQASNKTYDEFSGQVSVSVHIDEITPIKGEGNKTGVKIQLSIIASRIFSIDGEDDRAELTMKIEYPSWTESKNENNKSMNPAQAFASLVTYAEKKAKQCICNLIDESEKDLDSEEVEVSSKIEGL